jgi:hypothetical protein
VIILRARLRRDKARPSAHADSEILFFEFVENRTSNSANRRFGNQTRVHAVKHSFSHEQKFCEISGKALSLRASLSSPQKT